MRCAVQYMVHGVVHGVVHGISHGIIVHYRHAHAARRVPLRCLGEMRAQLRRA